MNEPAAARIRSIRQHNGAVPAFFGIDRHIVAGLGEDNGIQGGTAFLEDVERVLVVRIAEVRAFRRQHDDDAPGGVALRSPRLVSMIASRTVVPAPGCAKIFLEPRSNASGDAM